MPRSPTHTSGHATSATAKSALARFWEPGYAYLAVSFILVLIYTASPAVGILDWRKELAYFTFIRQSLVDFHSLPWFWWNKPAFLSAYPAAAYSSNFVSNPESMLFSPFTPLLLFMQVVQYVKVLGLIHWIIGIAGCFALRLRLKWHPLQFRLYLLLFALSPLVMQHLAVGYTPWLNLYFFPWLVFFLADRLVVRRVLGVAIVLGLTLLQGGIHVALWFFLMLLLYALSRSLLDRTARPLLELSAIALLTLWLAWIRLYATFPVYAGFHQAFGLGYSPLNFLFWSFYAPFPAPALIGLLTSTVWLGAPAWDAGVFWGGMVFLALLLVLDLGAYQRQRAARSNDPLPQSLPAALLISAIALLVLSFDSVLSAIVRIAAAVIPTGLIEAAEKYPFRLAIPASLVLTLLVAEYAVEIFDSLQAFGKKAAQSIPLLGRAVRVALIVALALLVLGLAISWISTIQPGSAAANGILRVTWIVQLLKYQVPILAALAIGILLLWLTDSILGGSPGWLEAAIGVPLILASIFWLSVGISVPVEKYPVQDAAAPNVILEPAGSRARVTASPYELVLSPIQGAEPTSYSFPRTDSRDAAWLQVASGNAVLTQAADRLAVRPQASGEIIVAFETRGYRNAALLTLCAWIFAMIVLFVRSRLPAGLNASSNDRARRR